MDPGSALLRSLSGMTEGFPTQRYHAVAPARISL
jgi:hypothetical protein